MMVPGCTKMRLLLLLSLLPLVITRGFAILSPLKQNYGAFQHKNSRIRVPAGSADATNVIMEQLRGGALTTRVARRNTPSSNEISSDKSNNRTRNVAIGVVITAVIALLGYEYRAPLSAAFDKEALQQNVLKLLHSFHGDWRGVVLYGCGMAVWELLGMSTIPVETAAGMVFGFQVGFLASACGKLAGATMGFVLGRTVLNGFIGHRLENNKTIKLIHDHVNQNPYKVALLMRYSLLPEFVKNCGASLFPPITTIMFMGSVILHGWMYSACWTYLGVDTARRLETPGLPANRLAQFALLWATGVGMVLTPIIMAWWIRDMQTSELNIMDDGKKNKKKS